jgi:hypothetical protein
VLQKELIPAAFTAEVVGLAAHLCNLALSRENIGATLGVLDQFGGTLASRDLLLFCGFRTFYQTTEELVKYNEEKNKNGETYH